MSSPQKQIIEGISFNQNSATTLTFTDLFTWVIWQYPRLKHEGYCGAIRAPHPESKWLPAIIRHQKKEVVVYGNAGITFPTPEAAADWVATIQR